MRDVSHARELYTLPCERREAPRHCTLGAATPAWPELMRGRAAVYPIPASHTQQGWELEHGAPAVKGAAGCANCHTQASCRSCHIGAKGEAAIAQLSPPATLASQRVTIGVAPSRKAVHPRDFAKAHKSTAASGRLDCLGCHEQRQCTSCHEGSGSRRYHAANFVGRHAADAYGQEQNCSSCHRTETFCRSCHQQTGVTVSGARTGAVHTGQPLRRLQHGQAARQGLTEARMLARQQRDCLACHSNLGLHVNPHALDFNRSDVGAQTRPCA